MTHQRNLCHLEILYDQVLKTNEKRDFGVTLALRQLEPSIFEIDNVDHDISPGMFSQRKKIRTIPDKAYLAFISENKLQILDFLNSDLIYTNVANNFPFLVEYIVLGGLHIDMRTRTILNNGIAVSLEP